MSTLSSLKQSCPGKTSSSESISIIAKNETSKEIKGTEQWAELESNATNVNVIL